jgi:uncharacterized protein affecting Mg2+/Co2+ transport
MADESFDFVTAETDNIMVSAYQEPLEKQENQARTLWAYCLRIENNSSEKIRLLRKDFCITDNHGHNHYEQSFGFHGELPDLEAGECFEFEDTITIDGDAAVLYGFCRAKSESGQEIAVKLPLIQLNSNQYNALQVAACH